MEIQRLENLIVELKKEKARIKSKIRNIDNPNYFKNYRKNNKIQINKNNKKYSNNNRNKLNQKNQKYRLTETGKKNERIRSWRWQGLIGNYDEIYERYLNTENCDNCNVKLTIDRYKTKTTKCMDHNHVTGEFRNILCHSCNNKRG